ncbi:MAG: 50S ribosomal protein L4 [Acidobacteria bacterium]|nr:50S ribosomal protein L4 [Acidobacteriota bacterium]
MATIEVKTLANKKVKQIDLEDKIFASKPNTGLLWEAVRHHLAGLRRGTHSTKTRSEVRGGGAKPWRQKGTGRARHGSSRSPLWRHGGIAHGPQPRDYSFRIPKKVMLGALRSALAAKFQEQKLSVVDQFKIETPKTKELAKILKNFSSDKKLLIVNHERNSNLELSSRNLQGVKLVLNHEVNPYDLLNHETVVISEAAILRLQEVLAR